MKYRLEYKINKFKHSETHLTLDSLKDTIKRFENSYLKNRVQEMRVFSVIETELDIGGFNEL